jgi:hypothetical protein
MVIPSFSMVVFQFKIRQVLVKINISDGVKNVLANYGHADPALM